MNGKLIVFEGPEGCGKSTQAARVYGFLKAKNTKTVYLREPGGVAISEKIRKIILDPENTAMASKTELLLYIASRAQIIEEKIKKLLKAGNTIILDRFYLSTIVYQGYARGLDLNIIKLLNQFVLGTVDVDLTVVYDVSWATAQARLAGRVKRDRLDMEKKKFHLKVRAAYLKEAAKMKNTKIIKTDGKDEETVLGETLDYLRGKEIFKWR